MRDFATTVVQGATVSPTLQRARSVDVWTLQRAPSVDVWTCGLWTVYKETAPVLLGDVFVHTRNAASCRGSLETPGLCQVLEERRASSREETGVRLPGVSTRGAPKPKLPRGATCDVDGSDCKSVS